MTVAASTDARPPTTNTNRSRRPIAVLNALRRWLARSQLGPVDNYVVR